MRRISFLRIAASIAITALFALPAIAQKQKSIRIDNDGEFHLDSAVNFGGSTATPGMYRVYHIAINNDHFIVIRKVQMSNYWKTMGPVRLGDQVARLKCSIEPIHQPNKLSRLVLSEKLGDRRVAQGIWFRGEVTKHHLLSN